MKKIKRIADRKQYVLPHDEGVHKLAIIENQYPPSPKVVEAVRGVGDFHLYPHLSDNMELINRIASMNSVSGDEVILTNGSDNALLLVINAWCEAGSVINIPYPTYPHFVAFAETSPASVNMFRIGIETSMRVADIVCEKCEPGLCYLVSPNMPMGYVMEVEDIKRCLISRPDVLFIVDHAYVEYGGKLATELIRHHDNIIITRTFSKAFGLAGLRLGYLMSTKGNISYLMGVVNEKNVTPVACAAAMAALDDLEYYMGNVAETGREKVRIRDTLKRYLGSKIYDFSMGGGNFYMIYARDPAWVCREFARRGVIVRDKSSEIKDAIRIMVGRPDQNDCVLDVIFEVNIGSMLRKSKLVFDLDNTLRYGSKNSVVVWAGAKLAEHGIICTNNCTYTPDEIAEYFASYGISVAASNVYSPLTEFLRVVGDQSYCVVGRVSKWFPHSRSISDAKNVFIGCDYFLSSDDIISIVKNKPVVYYPYNTTYTTFDDYADSPESGQDMLPDVGSIINMLRPLVDTVMIGKPNITLPVCGSDVIVIGDGEADHQLASKLGGKWVDCKQTHIDKLYEEYLVAAE